MKTMSAAIVLALATGSAFAGIVGPGSIAFTGFNGDGNDNLAFVALDPIPAGFQIGFTDNEWNGTAWIDANEFGWSWTASSDIAAGTIVTIDEINSLSITSNLGTVAAIDGAGTNRGVANSNEAVFAFVGNYAAPAAFLAAIGNDPLVSGGAAATLAGTGLVEGTSALFITGDEDIMAYNGARSGANAFGDYLSQINDAANWLTQDASGDQHNDGIFPDVPFSGEAFTIVPAPGAALLALGGMMVGGRRRR